MSTPHRTDRTTSTVPAPRQSADPPVGTGGGRHADPADVEHRSGNRQAAEDEPLGLFGRYAWLTPVLGVACTLAVFVSMILLTWIAGGGTPFD
jgi:hypothetical protein